MKIGDRIRELRKANRMTQDDLAAKLDTTKQTIYKYETGIITNIPSDKIERMAQIFGVEPPFLMGWDISDNSSILRESESPYGGNRAVKIPVLGTVVAGMPISAYQDILGYEEITPEMAQTGEFYALKVKGNSMEPRICEGDIVIVKVQPDVECGDIAVVIVNGDEATVKKISKSEEGITLIANNTAVYTPRFYTNKQIAELPVIISGKVVELRATF